MHIYKEKENSINHEGSIIPMVVGNKDYEAILAEVEAGLATIEYYKGSDREAADLRVQEESEARLWRNEELSKADLDLNRELDGMTNFGVSSIREWRVILRDWPSQDSFPNIKPVRNY